MKDETYSKMWEELKIHFCKNKNECDNSLNRKEYLCTYFSLHKMEQLEKKYIKPEFMVLNEMEKYIKFITNECMNELKDDDKSDLVKMVIRMISSNILDKIHFIKSRLFDGK